MIVRTGTKRTVHGLTRDVEVAACASRADGDPVVLVRALTLVERAPLLLFLGRSKSLDELGREFPGVSRTTLQASLEVFCRAGWLALQRTAHGGARVTLRLVAPRTLAEALSRVVPGAAAAKEWTQEQLRLEVAAFRRPLGWAVLRALASGVETHAGLVAATGAQSGVVSGVVGRLRLAGIVHGQKLMAPELQLLLLVQWLRGDGASDTP